MGFEHYEAQAAILPAQAAFPLPDDGTQRPLLPVEAVIPMPVVPTQTIPDSLRDSIEIRPTSTGATVIVRGELTAEVEDFLLAGCKPGKQQQAVQDVIERERARQDAQLAPACRGIQFAPLPQLCLDWDGELQPVERRVLAELGEFDLFAEAVSLRGFSVTETGTAWEINVDGDRVVYDTAESGQLHLNEVKAHADEHDLVRTLDRACRQVDVGQATLLKWLLALVRHLIGDRGLSLTALVRSKYLLAEEIRREIDRRRQVAIKGGFQKALPGFSTAPMLADSAGGWCHAFTFRPNQYPARQPFYTGRFRFKKHYYPVIHDLREKRADGTPAEEFVCARAIDTHPAVKHWVRNVERDERFSFWLPTATDYFYPDFVAELNDGRVLVVEYKGAHLIGDDTREKEQIGRQWAESSGEKCLFRMAVANDSGRDVATQIADKITGVPS